MLAVRDHRISVREAAALIFTEYRVFYKAPGIPTSEAFDFLALQPTGSLTSVGLAVPFFCDRITNRFYALTFLVYILLIPSMSTTRPTYDVPITPPRLTSWQRSRLVRSTRKLAKILGETPLHEITPPSPQTNKSRDIVQQSSRSPIVSLTKKFARTAFEPIQVALRREPEGDIEGARSINSERANAGTPSRQRDQSPAPVPNLAPVDSRARYISQVSSGPSPIESSYRGRQLSVASISSSCLVRSLAECEEFEEEREARSRRRRLSKLTRHLGESIPPDLIISKITSKRKSSTNTHTFIPPVVSNPSAVRSAALPLEQGTPFSSTTLSNPISKTPNPAVAGKVDSFVGSIGRSLSQRFNAGVTSPRLLAQRLRRSRSEATLSLSHEHLTLIRPDTYFAADDRPDTPIDGGYWVPPQSEPPLSSLRPLPGISPNFDAISHLHDRD